MEYRLTAQQTLAASALPLLHDAVILHGTWHGMTWLLAYMAAQAIARDSLTVYVLTPGRRAARKFCDCVWRMLKDLYVSDDLLVLHTWKDSLETVSVKGWAGSLQCLAGRDWLRGFGPEPDSVLLVDNANYIPDEFWPYLVDDQARLRHIWVARCVDDEVVGQVAREYFAPLVPSLRRPVPGQDFFCRLWTCDELAVVPGSEFREALGVVARQPPPAPPGVDLGPAVTATGDVL